MRILRAPEDPVAFPLATGSLLAWTMAFNHTLTRTALRATEAGAYDVIHAHDWLVAHTAITLADHLDLPLVTTIHATEAGRHQGWLPGGDEPHHPRRRALAQRLLHPGDHLLGVHARPGHRTVRRTDRTGRRGAQRGRQPGLAGPAEAVASARARFAGDGPLVGYAGRLVYEKGVQHLVHAVPRLRERHPGLRVVIAGDGPYRAELEAEARRLALSSTVRFTGFLDSTQLPAMLGATDATVVPSLYEPFGMVALEAAAAGAPLAVARTGGLAEIVEPGVTGVTFPHSDPDALAGAVGQLLGDEVFARRVARRARTMVGERYGWATIAARTAASYAAARREHGPLQARRAAAQLAGGRTRIAIPEGNLLARDGHAAC